MRPKDNDLKLLQSAPILIEAAVQDMQHTRLPRCMHRHDDRVEILYIRKGQGLHEIDGQLYVTKAGDVLVFDADVLHDECADRSAGLEILSCSVGNVQIKGFLPNRLLADGFCPVIYENIYTKRISGLLETIYELSKEREREKEKSKDVYADELTEYLLKSLLLSVCRAGEKTADILSKKMFEMGMRVKEYIDENYLDDIDIASVAAALKIGESYVSRTFKKATGYSVMQYIIRRRIGEAQSWLLMSNLSVTDIAVKVGYNSVSNFHATFSRLVGMSPQRYRQYWKEKK